LSKQLQGSPFQLAIPYGAWKEAVGAKIASRAAPLSLQSGTLTVRVTTSAWAQELSLLESDLRARLSEHGYLVERFRFQVGSVDLWARPSVKLAGRVPDEPAELTAAITSHLDAIGDDDLRRILKESAGYSLSLGDRAKDQGVRTKK
jgi:Dna[CI] antecedent, DciA